MKNSIKRIQSESMLSTLLSARILRKANTYNRYITLAAMTLTFAACSQDEDFAPQTDGDAVKINATIGTMPQTRLTYGTDGTTTFASGDQIRVINQTRSGKSKSDATYKFDGSAWEPATTTNYVVWEGTDANTFRGIHPATANDSTFTIPEDQDTDALLTAADWMTATYSGAKSAGCVNLAFQHLLTKVTVRLTKWNSEFDDPNSLTIIEPRIITKGSPVTAAYSKDATTGTTTVTITPSDNELTIIKSEQGEISGYRTFTAIVAPNAKYAANEEFVLFSIGAQKLIVLAKEKVLTDGLQPGKHYTFDLTVGKEKAEISSVSVTKWTPQAIDGGVAEATE